MSEDFIDDVRSSFLLPWEVKLNSLLSAAGHQVVNGPDIFFPGSPLEQARDVIIEVAFMRSQPMDERQKQDVVRQIDWLLDLLGSHVDPEYVGWGAAYLPEAFWLNRESNAGVAIIRALEQCLGEDFVNLQTAAERLGVDRGRLYHMHRNRAFPVFYDPTVAHPMRRLRVRVPQVEQALKEIDGE